MKIEVIASPALFCAEHFQGRTVVVLDVLRATTTMIAALAAGARQIHVFDSVESAAAAASGCKVPKLLHGERRALPPPGFDLGNSPGDFTPERCHGRTCFMTTTNGTVAILAAREADELLIGAVVNARAVANYVAGAGRDVTLLCAGQRMDLAMEDLIGCGAIIHRLPNLASAEIVNDAVHLSLDLYRTHRENLGRIFRLCRGARTELLLGLEADIDYCAVEDRFNIVGRFDRDTASIKLAV